MVFNATFNNIQLYCGSLIAWCLTPTLAIFQLYCGVLFIYIS